MSHYPCLALVLALNTFPLGWPLGSPLGSPLVSPVEAQTPQDPRDGWTRVQQVAPGAEIIVNLANLTDHEKAGQAPRLLQFLDAGTDQLTVLDLAGPELSEPIRRDLRRLAARRPDYFTRAAAGEQIVDGRLHLNATGIFEHDRFLIGLGDVMKKVPRLEIRQVALRRRGRGFWGHAGPLGGSFIGGMVGGWTAAAACRCDGGFLPGMVAGGLTGAIVGWRRAGTVSDQVIYPGE